MNYGQHRGSSRGSGALASIACSVKAAAMNQEKSNVQTRTRLNQIGVISPLLLPFFVAVLDATLPVSIAFTFKAAIGAAITALLFLLGMINPSRSEVAKIEKDRIIFKYRKSIQFGEIESFNFDDYLKLKIRGEFWLLLLQCTRKNQDEYNEFLANFKLAFNEWQQQKSEVDLEIPQQSFFYGSWKAILAGGFLIAVYLCLIVAALRVGAALGYVVIGGLLVIPISLRLIFSRRRE